MTLTKNNEWADYWYYEIGVNVISADTRNKTTDSKWSKYQFESVPEEEHEEKKGKIHGNTL